MADGTQPSAPITANGHHPSISVTATTTTDPAILEQVVNHVFLPPKLPSSASDDDTERSVNLLMLDETDAAARAFRMFLPHEQRKPWTQICRMLLWMKQAAKAPLEATKLSETLKSMLPGDVLALHVRAQNAAIIIRMGQEATVFEVFEVSPLASEVIAAKGKLIRAFPGPGVKVETKTVSSQDFRDEFSSFIAQMDIDILDEVVKRTRTKTGIREEKETADPKYISELLIGILRGMGEIADVRRVVKRIADDSVFKSSGKPWRRSSLWLILRVAIETTLDDVHAYKSFMLFLHAKLLNKSREAKFNSDLLFTMRAKMSRRLFKLGTHAPNFVVKEVKESGEATEGLLQKRWTTVQEKAAESAPWQPEDLQLMADTAITLPNSRSYISGALHPATGHNKSNVFNPNHHPRLNSVTKFEKFAKDNNVLTHAVAKEKYVALADFEQAVAENLDEWVRSKVTDDEASDAACNVVSSCLTQYYKAASTLYEKDAEEQSIMLLTVMELWVALDKLATAACPLLEQYSPEIPANFLDPLLLRQAQAIERANNVERYLRGRHELTVQDMPVFSDAIDSSSFAYKYFEDSARMKATKKTIEEVAQRRKAEKGAELDRLNAEYAALMAQADTVSHKTFENDDGLRVHVKRGCRKCDLENKASALKIKVYEWPLPEDEERVRRIVFELQVPPAFAFWRDVTYKILVDIGAKEPRDKTTAQVVISDYEGLMDWVVHPHAPRVTLASPVKSYTMSVESEKKIPADEASVIVNNGLKFQLFDTLGKSWASHPIDTPDIRRLCTLSIPETSPYAYLQYSVENTTHQHNHVIATQHQCPKALDLHEHHAFASLRCGSLLQWMNILREIASNALTFNREEVHTLITQAAWQIGAFSKTDNRREWHVDLGRKEFGKVLLEQLRKLLQRVKSNWLEGVTVRTIALLVSRLLATATQGEILEGSYALLREVRGVALQWTRELAEKLQGSHEEDQVAQYQVRVCEMAATCRATYDVDPQHVSEICHSPEDIAVFIECAITVHNNTPASFSTAPMELKRLLAQDRRLSHRLESHLAQSIEADRTGLDKAIQALWASYRPGAASWKAVEGSPRWLRTRTDLENGQNAQRIHINLLSGELLIAGKPLGRLPREMVSSQTYSRIFGQKVLDVVPSDRPGMSFATRTLLGDYQIYFGHRPNNPDELIVQARHENKFLELIPHEQFTEDIPSFLLSDYAHWLDPSTRTVDFRPLASVWDPASCEWRLNFSDSPKNTSTLIKVSSSEWLIDVHSPTFEMISTRLRHLEAEEYITITYGSITHRLLVDLPRLRLSFALNEEHQLESQNMPGLIVDDNQSCGTLFGLRNRLVLCSKDPMARQLPMSRRVLVPHGEVKASPTEKHVVITISPGQARRVTYHEYLIDTDLGCLKSTVSLTSRLFKVYLHALTSHCLPDPLLGRTGTEEALAELESASCRSFQRLDVADADLLRKLGALTPNRTSPSSSANPNDKGSKTMQKIDWLQIAPLSQHHGFVRATKSIIELAKRLEIFQDEKVELNPYVIKRDENLLERASRRNSIYYSWSTPFTEVESDVEPDVEYVSRDALLDGADDREYRIYKVSKFAQSSEEDLAYTSHSLLGMMRNWKEPIEGSSEENWSLSYSRDWLQPPSLASIWLAIYQLCVSNGRAHPERTRMQLTFSLSAFKFGAPEHKDLIPVILAFANNPKLAQFLPPQDIDRYNLADGFEPTQERVEALILRHRLDVKGTPAWFGPKEDGESTRSQRARQRREWSTKTSAKAMLWAKAIVGQWSTLTLPPPGGDFASWFSVGPCKESVQAYLRSCHNNKRLGLHVRQVERTLQERNPGGYETSRDTDTYSFQPPSRDWQPAQSSIVMDEIFETRRAWRTRSADIVEFYAAAEIGRDTGEPVDTADLQDLLSDFRQPSSSTLLRKYGDDLDLSRADLEGKMEKALPDRLSSSEDLETIRAGCLTRLEHAFQRIKERLSPSNAREEVLATAGLWPTITHKSVLGRLAMPHRTKLSEAWRAVLVLFAQALIEYQRCMRLIGLAASGKVEEFYKEADNNEFNYRDALEYPDWLLIQIEANFFARKIQTDFAHEMIEPSSKRSTVLQLNMGEGKSSVIVPKVAAALADGEKLLRVVVLKSLSSQMFQLLVERLSGLVNRRIFFMPFSRNVQVNREQVTLFRKMYEQGIAERAVLLAMPEHILSFRLAGLDNLISAYSDEEQSTALALQKVQDWLSDKTRDVLDESDEILHVRFQLVYTVGSQRPLEDHPDRWTTTQQIFTLAKQNAQAIRQRFPKEFELEQGPPGTFPVMRILGDEAARAFVAAVAKDALSGGLSTLTFALLPNDVRNAAYKFITEKEIVQGEFRVLRDFCGDSSTWKGLLLLRGLLALGIIVHTLRDKRYRVDFGLDLSRTLLAVPYRAKDIPSLRSEFGHPDVAISLTCLSYYYSSLTSTQLRQAFESLYKLDNPALEYDQWIRGSDGGVPKALGQLSGINVKDNDQFDNLVYPLFSKNHAVVDFFLRQIVFPKEAKEFPAKLQTSGWDLAATKTHVTTGFSGTNDNRYLLPTSIVQDDPLHQLSTNALVLMYLLRPENDAYVCTQKAADNHACSAKQFLKLLVQQTPEVRVLLDVGAQMLELQNQALVAHWLELRPDVAAAIFFSESDELAVLTQDGAVESFISSPYKQQLDSCIVYLDDAHTRGTDLKLPPGTRAAVTLGPKTSKDRLLQGCMRMRKLGKGHSVMFFAPLEVDRRIRHVANKGPRNKLKVLDILRWCMHETVADVTHHLPHWAQQGVDYMHRKEAEEEYRDVLSPEDADIKVLERGWKQQESQTLEEMYGLSSSLSNTQQSSPQHKAFEIPELRERLEELGVTFLTNPKMEEEQEREVAHEVERERQIERPAQAGTAKHRLHRDLETFIETGKVRDANGAGGVGITSLFLPLHKGNLRDTREVWSPSLLSTWDFIKTIEVPGNKPYLDEYLRPVQWILSSVVQGPMILVVVSPFEVNALLPKIRKSRFVNLHVYTPRVTQSMQSFSDLRFFTVPPLPADWTGPPIPKVQLQLDLFAGQLYLPNYPAYLELCTYLGIYTGPSDGEDVDMDLNIQSDGFIRPEDRPAGQQMAMICPFNESPLSILKQLVGLRRKGMSYQATHMGKILHARPLTKGEFEEEEE